MLPGIRDVNQIRHILISKKCDRIENDTKLYRGACADSDRFFVISKIKMKIIKVVLTRNIGRRWNMEKLKTEHMKEKYISDVSLKQKQI